MRNRTLLPAELRNAKRLRGCRISLPLASEEDAHFPLPHPNATRVGESPLGEEAVDCIRGCFAN